MSKKVMEKTQRRVLEEQDTVARMIGLYCRVKHRHTQGLCPDCADLQAYTQARIRECMFQPEKPACSRCPVHCYSPSRRAQIRAVMRFAGPRMLWHAPLAALRHFVLLLQKPSLRVQEFSNRKKRE